MRFIRNIDCFAELLSAEKSIASATNELASNFTTK